MSRSKSLQGKVVATVPELPEIEAVKRVMEPQIKGLAIQRLTVRKPEVIAHPDADEFGRQVTGQIFAGIGRKGKFLILCMESGDRFRTLVVSDDSGCCGREKKIHTAESKSWVQIPLNFASPGNIYLHDWENERRSSSSACWIKVL